MAARFHTALTEIPRVMVTVDQLDGNGVICAEMACRYLIMIETACSRSPRQPDWDGLESSVTCSLTPQGGIEVPKFMSWCEREEKSAEDKRRKACGKPAEDG